MASICLSHNGWLCKISKIWSSKRFPLRQLQFQTTNERISQERHVCRIYQNDKKTYSILWRRWWIIFGKSLFRWLSWWTFCSQHLSWNYANKQSIKAMDHQSDGSIILEPRQIVNYWLQNLFRWYLHFGLSFRCHQFRFDTQPKHHYQRKIQIRKWIP